MTTDAAVEAEAGVALSYLDSERVIETAMSLALEGRMTAADVIEMGCMTPDCLTAATLRRVARAAGVSAASLLA